MSKELLEKHNMVTPEDALAAPFEGVWHEDPWTCAPKRVHTGIIGLHYQAEVPTELASSGRPVDTKPASETDNVKDIVGYEWIIIMNGDVEAIESHLHEGDMGSQEADGDWVSKFEDLESLTQCFAEGLTGHDVVDVSVMKGSSVMKGVFFFRIKEVENPGILL